MSRRIGKKSIHVWLPAALVEKIRAENDKANKDSPWYKRENFQETYERILGAFFEPKGKKKTKA